MENNYKESYYSFFENVLNNLRKRIFSINKYKLILDINEELTINSVNKAYKKKAMECHPDTGGNQEDFIKINNAKEKLLQYLQYGLT